jgi:hypothetical protein
VLRDFPEAFKAAFEGDAPAPPSDVSPSARSFKVLAELPLTSECAKGQNRAGPSIWSMDVGGGQQGWRVAAAAYRAVGANGAERPAHGGAAGTGSSRFTATQRSPTALTRVPRCRAPNPSPSSSLQCWA